MTLRKHRQIQLIVPEMATHGGIQSYMLRILEMLNELPGTKVECVALNDTDAALSKRAPDATGSLRGYNRNKLHFILGLLLRKRSDAIAIVGHIHFAPVALAAKLLGGIQSYIVILHGIEAWKRHNWLVRWAMRQAISNVATTHYTAELSACLNGIPLSQHHVIPLCAERDIPTPSPGFKLNGDFPLLMVARLDSSEKYKGMEMVIDAVAILKQAGVPAHFNVVGDGDDRFRLERYALEKGCRQLVTFWGRLSDADLQAAYKTATMFVMPSKKEGFGIVFLEAMRHGVPCIGGNHGGTPEVIHDGETGVLVNYGDVMLFVDQLSMLWSNADTYTKMSKACMKVYDDQFTYNVFSDRWSKLIQNELTNAHLNGSHV